MMWGGGGGGGGRINLGGNIGGGPPGMNRGTLANSEADFGRAFDSRILKRLWTFMSPFKLRVVFGVAMLLVYTATVTFFPLIPGYAINALIAHDSRGLVIWSMIFLANSLVMWLSQYQQVYQMTWVGQHALYNVSSAMFQHIAHLSLEFFDRNETGRVMARMQNDVTVLQATLSNGVLQILGSVLSLAGIFVAIMLLHWRLGLMVFSIVPVMAAALWFWQRQARHSFLAARAAISTVNASIQENVSGIRVIQSLSRERRNAEAFGDVNTNNLNTNLKASRMSALIQPMVELLAAIAMAIAVFAGGLYVLRGELQVGFLVAFVVYTNRFFDPIRDATQQYINLQRATVAAERIFEILDTEENVKDAPDALTLEHVQGAVDFDHVRFGYIEGTEVLHDLDLHIKAGEHIALVGPTGAGKSTVISLLARFYDVTGGNVRVDGQDVREVTQQSLRRSLGIVLQDPVLFLGTVHENIAYGNKDATDQEIEAAARAVGAHEMIERLPQGYETSVAPNSSNLSGGQRQLITLARAMLVEPRILLLDEATAGIDPHTEAVLQRGLVTLMEGRTAIVIAHRLSTVRNADRIVVIEDGRVVEQGTHDELFALGGAYYALSMIGFADVTTPDAGTASEATPANAPA
ncbi:MAG: ABC transporter ATP-binding protein [Chloroflexota bacterium]